MNKKELNDIATQLRLLADRLDAIATGDTEIGETLKTIETLTAPAVREPDASADATEPAIAFALNDRYRFKRELFGGSEEAMNSAVSDIADLTSAEAVEHYLTDNDYDMDSDVVKDFLRATTRRFDAKPRLLG